MPGSESFIDTFLEATSGIGAPRIFRLWGAISTISGALEQKVWMTSSRGRTYPQTYILLAGRPGVGKSIALEFSRRYLAMFEDQFIAPTNVSRASIVDALNEARRRIVVKGEEIEFNSLKVIISEFGVFLPAYEMDFMAILTDIWNIVPFEERKRSLKHHIKMDRPQLNILAGTTPSQLTQFLPEGAWEQGFMSRTHVIYSGEVVLTSLFAPKGSTDAAFLRGVELLRPIAARFGEIRFEKDAAEAIDAWHLSGGKPAPDHPKLINYIVRRTEHLFKLCMISACDRGNATITIEDYARALGWLIEAETSMVDIFHEMRSGGMDAAQEECYHYIMKAYMKDGAPVVEARVVNFLRARVASTYVMQTIEIMVRAGILVQTHLNSVIAYKPGERS